MTDDAFTAQVDHRGEARKCPAGMPGGHLLADGVERPRQAVSARLK